MWKTSQDGPNRFKRDCRFNWFAYNSLFEYSVKTYRVRFNVSFAPEKTRSSAPCTSAQIKSICSSRRGINSSKQTVFTIVFVGNVIHVCSSRCPVGVFKEDKFVHSYMNKHYNTGHTELLSMFFSELSSTNDFIDLCRKDKEYVKFFYKLLKGKIWKF